jgi:hypothetical protein
MIIFTDKIAELQGRKEGREVKVGLATEARYFYLLHSILTSSGAQPAPDPMDTMASFLRGKMPGERS